jgi:nicotinate-nucleotide adenylyltransferase
VVVFGGSFSPPTQAHEAIVRQCLALAGFDEVWLVPSSDRTDKNISVPPQQQMEMLEILASDVFLGNPRLKINHTELKRGIATETYDTYQEFLRDYPATDFWFVFGSDSYATIRTWLNGDWLAQNLPVLLVERNGHALPPAAAHIRHLAPLPGRIAPISSTLVRAKLKAHEDIRQLVPGPVADYVEDVW